MSSVIPSLNPTPANAKHLYSVREFGRAGQGPYTYRATAYMTDKKVSNEEILKQHTNKLSQVSNVEVMYMGLYCP